MTSTPDHPADEPDDEHTAIRRAVWAMPPLTDEQINALAVLLATMRDHPRPRPPDPPPTD
ncbi:hypothetical protein CcI156_22035 [Frankia sp. CcI156]|uniref:hypothetical protein n=1 Tax=Frankia TaxID=1854 RepID=UPI0002EE8AA0|nr:MULTISPECIES: hypothetical protein [Frankia]ESZ99836.1 hypothetical protein CcI6DRAFT_04758 [Frankia sp. CcI6]EYT90199.1 hypothetical protein ThrDRAFT_04189 [Frankia casuarinae]KDA40620.1 hypothetical protein BMG523Draft_04562 [Frankia sp. BMG5.23]KEZ34248.1 hypothetical protein CEDDRAFT_04401 [Frankia sp. CeD]KFB04629.1 hypothetical protein ALLO2DRAFT_02558 [Frankia sp. Allo2]